MEIVASASELALPMARTTIVTEEKLWLFLATHASPPHFWQQLNLKQVWAVGIVALLFPSA